MRHTRLSPSPSPSQGPCPAAAAATASTAGRGAAILAELRDGDWLSPETWGTPQALHAALRQVAALDLGAGRLLEGHAHAHRLIRAHGAPAQLARTREAMRAGRLFAVWAEDGDRPVDWDGRALHGTRQIPDGLGLADAAVVVARRADGGRQLALVDASDPGRRRPAEREAPGQAGGFDCEGLAAEPLGPPDFCAAAPRIVGGTWRLAAVTLGGVLGLLERRRAALARRGRAEAEAQLPRLAPLGIRALGADAAVARAAEVAEGPAGRAEPLRAAAFSIAARLLTEALGRDAIAAVARPAGPDAGGAEDSVGRMALDLADWLRQAAAEATTLRIGRDLFAPDASLESWFDA